MDIPQEILNKFICREDYLDWIKKETAIIAYLDLTNMFYWQDVLGWKFRIKDVVTQLKSFQNIKEVKIYYGKNEQNEEEKKKSDAFQKRILETGANLKTKKVKFIKKTIDEALLFKKNTRNLFNQQINEKMSNLIEEIKNIEPEIYEPKCNFDVEIAMDMIDDADKVSAIMLFSGDSDLLEPLERLKVKGKRICVIGVRYMVAGELHAIGDKYFNFGQFYNGKRRYKSENPAFGGTA